MKRKDATCPYLTHPNPIACGTDLCHLQQVGAGADGIVMTCGGFGSPAYHPAEIVLEDGSRSTVWVGSSPWPTH